ncbi:MAG TPA: APC family permease [Candidatus Acidoferrum sp.]|jgi:amino acid transporter
MQASYRKIRFFHRYSLHHQLSVPSAALCAKSFSSVFLLLLFPLYRQTTSALSATTTTLNSTTLSLRKELGFTDLVLASILLVVVPDFFGTAVKAGPSHVVLWLIAIALFFIPQALVVSHLNERMPMEGGLYEWARHAFGDAVGFIVAWNLWLYVVLYVAAIGLVAATYAAYALGLDAEAIASNKWIVLATSITILAGLMLVAHLGLRVGKWVTNVGSALTVLIIAFLALLPFLHLGKDALAEYHPLRLTLPPLSLFQFSVFSKMTFGALCGFEYAAIFAGESRNPASHLKKAIFVAAPIIALLYIFGASAILAYVSPGNIDVIGPIPQALRVALGGSGLAQTIVPIAILLLLTNYLSSFSLNFAANTRLPMCAGWDHLLPKWFTRLHPKYRTPINSILFLGGVTFVASTAVLIGVGDQEAFELLQIWGFTFYAIAYLALFAIPMFAIKNRSLRGPFWMRALSISGFLLTLLFVILSVIPIIPVASQSAYTLKSIAVLGLANIAGLVLYLKRPKRA